MAAKLLYVVAVWRIRTHLERVTTLIGGLLDRRAVHYQKMKLRELYRNVPYPQLIPKRRRKETAWNKEKMRSVIQRASHIKAKISDVRERELSLKREKREARIQLMKAKRDTKKKPTKKKPAKEQTRKVRTNEQSGATISVSIDTRRFAIKRYFIITTVLETEQQTRRVLRARGISSYTEQLYSDEDNEENDLGEWTDVEGIYADRSKCRSNRLRRVPYPESQAVGRADKRRRFGPRVDTTELSEEEKQTSV